ncbi:MAG: biotin--[acetyl-CoA-carboxylase] ligase [Candidatus Hodarchaeota archaeon]
MKTKIHSDLCPRIYTYADVDSTNNVARELIEENNQIGFAVVAERQSAGRGQGGRVWESPQGGLWTSLAIQPQIELSQLGMIPILSAVGIAKALEIFEIETLLKWPNDILIKHNLKKIGGILVEGKVTQFFLDYLIIGIGLNINSTLDQYSKLLRDQITTIFEEFERKIDLNRLLQEIIRQIEDSFESLRLYGAKSILEEWKEKDNIIGMNVIVQNPEGKYQGKVVDISQRGHLVLEISDSNRIELFTGTVSIQEN